MAAVPVMMFLLCCRKRDMLTTPASHVLLMFVLYLFLSVSRGLHDRAMTMLIVMSLVPMFMGLVSELVFREQPMAFSFFTLSFLLMFGVPWFAAAGGSFHAAVVTTVVWTVFGGTCFSAGFSLDRRYLRLMGILFLMAALLVTTYSTAILGWEAVIVSLLTFGAIAIIAAYFYYLRDPGGRGRGRTAEGSRER